MKHKKKEKLLIDKKECTNCGHILEKDSKVCNECGYDMSMEEAFKMYSKIFGKILNEQVTTSQTKEVKLLANTKGEVYRTTQNKVDPNSEVKKLPKGGSVVITKSADEGKNKKSKNKKPNPWAICTSSVGRENKEKYEKCVMDIKKQYKLDEELGRLEEYIERLITDSEINPKMKTKDFKNFVSKLKK